VGRVSASEIAFVPAGRVRCTACDETWFWEHGLLGRKSRQLAETMLQHGGVREKLLPASWRQLRAGSLRSPELCAPRDFSRHHRKRRVLLPPRKKTAPELIPERLPSDPNHITTCFVFSCTPGLDFSRSSGSAIFFPRH